MSVSTFDEMSQMAYAIIEGLDSDTINEVYSSDLSKFHGLIRSDAGSLFLQDRVRPVMLDVAVGQKVITQLIEFKPSWPLSYTDIISTVMEISIADNIQDMINGLSNTVNWQPSSTYWDNLTFSNILERAATIASILVWDMAALHISHIALRDAWTSSIIAKSTLQEIIESGIAVNEMMRGRNN